MKDTIKANDFYHVHNRVNVKGLPVAEVFDGDKFLFEAERKFYSDYKDEKDGNECFVFHEVFTTRKGNQFIYWGDTELDADYISLIE